MRSPANTSWNASRLGAASALFERNRPMQVWMTRYFKSLDQEEITVSVHPETGKVTGFSHTIPETQPGADIGLERAREIAAQFAASMGWDTSAMDLKESATEKKKARRDYSLEWEARPGDPRNVDQTRWRVEVNVAGDRVVSARGFWKLPESWQRGREQRKRPRHRHRRTQDRHPRRLSSSMGCGSSCRARATASSAGAPPSASPCPRRCCFPSPRCSPSA